MECSVASIASRTRVINSGTSAEVRPVVGTGSRTANYAEGKGQQSAADHASRSTACNAQRFTAVKAHTAYRGALTNYLQFPRFEDALVIQVPVVLTYNRDDRYPSLHRQMERALLER